MDNNQWNAWMQDREMNLYDGLHNYYEEEPLLCPNCGGSTHSRVHTESGHSYECAECGQNFYSVNGELRLV